jgi:hypothetical protein
MTRLPSDAPPAYPRSQLGEKSLAYIKRMGWRDQRYVTRLEPAPKPIVDLKA